MNGNVFLMLAVVGAIAVALWLGKAEHRHTRRIMIWLFAASAALLVIGISVWQDSLASLITTKIDLGVLLVIDITGAFLLWRHGGKKKLHDKAYHPVRSPFVALAAGTALTLTALDGVTFLRQLRHAPLGTASALGHAVTSVQSGKAAEIAHSSGNATEVLGIVGVAFVILFALAHRHHNRQPASKTAGRPQQAITSGGVPGNAPARQVPAGKRGS